MKTIFLFVLVFMSSCATVNFDPSKPITDAGLTYKQDGQIIDRVDLIKKLKDNPKTRDDAQLAEILQYVSIVPAGAGGLLLGLGLGLPSPKKATSTTAAQSGISDDDRSILLIGGGVSIVGGLILESLSSKRLSNAVSAHNSSLHAAPSTMNVTPFLEYATSGGVCGIRVEL